MKIAKKLIGDRHFYKKVAIIALPVLVQNIITNFVSLVDNIMVGQIGTEQMSGVAIVNQLIFVFNICIFGGISGAGIFTAQYFGKGDNKGVRDTFRAKLIICLSVTLIALGILIFFHKELISLFLHQSDDGLDLTSTLEYAKSYIYIMFLGLLPFAITQAYSGTLRETGQTVVPMCAGIAAFVTNVSLNYVLIFGKLGFPVLGVQGAAIATVIARYSECLVVVLWAHLNKAKCKFIKGTYRSFKIPKPLVKDIATKGAPLIFNEVMWSLGTTMLVQCYSVRGLEAVSAMNISSTVSNLFFCAFFALGSAVSIMVGQLLGAGQLERAVDEDRKLIALSVAVCVAIGGLLALTAPFFPSVYNTTNSIKDLATSLLRVAAVMMPLNAFVHMAYFTLRSGGKTIVTFLFDSVFVWGVSIPVAFVLSRFTGLPVLELYIIVQSLELIKCVIGFIMLKKKLWVQNLVKEN
ncbi:MAG: MATE family efflux transporter [Clostridia bacterium]|nr:MATE family efflux transporter [Clostridia bacterium]